MTTAEHVVISFNLSRSQQSAEEGCAEGACARGEGREDRERESEREKESVLRAWCGQDPGCRAPGMGDEAIKLTFTLRFIMFAFAVGCRYGHTMSNTPHPIRTTKLSDIGPT